MDRLVVVGRENYLKYYPPPPPPPPPPKENIANPSSYILLLRLYVRVQDKSTLLIGMDLQDHLIYTCVCLKPLTAKDDYLLLFGTPAT